MKTYLLKNEGNFYKANLHSHSNLSDGRLSPAEMKEAYKAEGYSILATSDHDALHCNYELTDDDFLVLTAYEISIRSDDIGYDDAYRRKVDLNLLAKEPHNMTQVGYHPESVEWLIRRGKMTQEEVDAIKFAPPLRDMHYYPANVNRIIKSANENGFLVTVNHPMWSMCTEDHRMFEGAWGVEVYNHGCANQAGLPDSEGVYDEILRGGKKIFALATDDNHSWPELKAWNTDCFGGYIWVKAPRLTYADVIDALVAGDFYASSGPEIHELYYDDETECVHIETSPAQEICMNTLGRLGLRIASPTGELITSADFKIDKERFGLVRFRVVGPTGKKAWTNPYYVDEFIPDAPAHRVII